MTITSEYHAHIDARRILIGRAAILARDGEGAAARKLRKIADAIPRFTGAKTEGGATLAERRQAAQWVVEQAFGLLVSLDPRPPGGQQVGSRPSPRSSLRDLRRAVDRFEEML